MVRTKPWERNWIVAEASQIRGGGQGTTRIVHHRGDDAKRSYVLKLLNRQRDPERRRRMYREVASLRTLDHPGIPKLIESNVKQFADLDVPLYFVQEFIPGRTLEEFVSKDRVSPTEAIRFFNRLLDILKYCHSRDVYHRDIKPDNIIVKGGDIEFPTLVDFGQSFNTEDREKLTLSDQHIGSRFLVLPEFISPESSRRDPRSDLTVSCGILFFVLTRIRPTTLLDDKQRMPHQRDKAADVLASLEGVNIPKLLRFFDQAFSIHIDYRFQSIESIRSVLIEVPMSTEKKEHEPSLSERASRIKRAFLSDAESKRRLNVMDALEYLNKQITEVLQGLLAELGEGFSYSQGGYNLDVSNLTLGNTLGIIHQLTGKSFKAQFIVSVAGSEIIVVAQHDSQTRDLLRLPLSDYEVDVDKRSLLAKFFLEGLESVVGGTPL